LIFTVGCTQSPEINPRDPQIIPPETRLVVPIANTDNDERRGDVVFVHGLEGDARTTWQCESSHFDWPAELAMQLPDIGVWSLNYNAAVSDWFDGAMPIEDRSKNLLTATRLEKLGDRPIILVGHSLGGVVVKQMLRDAKTLNNGEWIDFFDNVKGVVFLATPNGGSDKATAISYLDRLLPAFRASELPDQLNRNATILHELNIWYRNQIVESEIKTQVFYETEPTAGLVIVDKTSSDPGISGVTPIPVDANHKTICKPISLDSLVYKAVAQFIDEEVIPLPTKWDISFKEFSSQFKEVQNNDAQLAAFKALHVNQKVTWDAVIRNVNAHKKTPSYAIALSDDSPTSDVVIASCRLKDFNPDISPGTHVRITGIIKDSTNRLGAVLHRAKILGN
jgi:pimeloyl-ACP methyl ester carboxylesterase